MEFSGLSAFAFEYDVAMETDESSMRHLMPHIILMCSTELYIKFK